MITCALWAFKDTFEDLWRGQCTLERLLGIAGEGASDVSLVNLLRLQILMSFCDLPALVGGDSKELLADRLLRLPTDDRGMHDFYLVCHLLTFLLSSWPDETLELLPAKELATLLVNCPMLPLLAVLNSSSQLFTAMLSNEKVADSMESSGMLQLAATKYLLGLRKLQIILDKHDDDVQLKSLVDSNCRVLWLLSTRESLKPHLQKAAVLLTPVLSKMMTVNTQDGKTYLYAFTKAMATCQDAPPAAVRLHQKWKKNGDPTMNNESSLPVVLRRVVYSGLLSLLTELNSLDTAREWLADALELPPHLVNKSTYEACGLALLMALSLRRLSSRLLQDLQRTRLLMPVRGMALPVALRIQAFNRNCRHMLTTSIILLMAGMDDFYFDTFFWLPFLPIFAPFQTLPFFLSIHHEMLPNGDLLIKI
eukprot:CAMPEP_0177660970 /NCGR_PEP_ID=MMETSP0447-20121125/18372_1 /TAXON_ID=0 /ORGANISM="Stygamoeba regulata, Strain BSH-02190019" /LENGTH=421 /DNA_ID=CAMNT_0019166167 /DNA_START=108 /DNA_END=1373 /DNA_ORIENTATION=-